MEPNEVPAPWGSYGDPTSPPDPPAPLWYGEVLARLTHLEAMVSTMVGVLEQYRPLLDQLSARASRPAPFGLRGFATNTKPVPGLTP